MRLPRYWTRVAAPLALLAAVASFLLPWLTVTADERRAEATGLELVTRDTELTGHYVHDAWRGEVETVVGHAEAWALPTFVAVLIALGFALVPLRLAWWASLAVTGAAAVLALLWVQASSSTFEPPYSDRGAGVWVAVALLVTAAVPLIARLREPSGDPTLRRPPEWLDGRRG
jgi:hypothetical protein